MNRKQWYACAGILLAFALASAYLKGVYTGLVTATTVEYMFLTARAYEILQIVFFAGFFICLVCGYLEKNK